MYNIHCICVSDYYFGFEILAFTLLKVSNVYFHGAQGIILEIIMPCFDIIKYNFNNTINALHKHNFESLFKLLYL